MLTVPCGGRYYQSMTEKIVKHGTVNAYTNKGCRCEQCKQAAKEYRAKRHADPELRARHYELVAKYKATEQGKQANKDGSKRRRQRLRERIIEAKAHPCVDCGVSYPYYVMDLDHRPGEEKTMNLAVWHKQGAGGMEALNAEIAKCDPVCANCHRERTHNRP